MGAFEGVKAKTLEVVQVGVDAYGRVKKGVEAAADKTREVLNDPDSRIGRWNLRASVDNIGTQIDRSQAQILKLNASLAGMSPNQITAVRQQQSGLAEKIDDLAGQRSKNAERLSSYFERKHRIPLEARKATSTGLENSRGIRDGYVAERDKLQSEFDQLNSELTKIMVEGGDATKLKTATDTLTAVAAEIQKKDGMIGQMDSIMTRAETRIGVIESKYGKKFAQLEQWKLIKENGKVGTFAMPQVKAPTRAEVSSAEIAAPSAGAPEAGVTSPEAGRSAESADLSQLLKVLAQLLYEGTEGELEGALQKIQALKFKNAKKFEQNTVKTIVDVWNKLPSSKESQIDTGGLNKLNSAKNITELGMLMKRELKFSNKVIIEGIQQIGDALEKQKSAA